MITAESASKIRGFIEQLLNPLAIGFILLIVLIVFLLNRKEYIFRRVGWCALGFGIVFYLFCTPWLPRLMIRHLEQQYTRVDAINKDVCWVVVLGGGAQKNTSMPAADALSSASLKRFLEGLRLYKALPRAQLILSGKGSSDVKYAVGTRLDEVAAWLDVPKDDRVLEIASVNTADEARIVHAMIQDAPFYLVTSASHMPRSVALFKKQGMHPIPAPCDYAAYPSEDDALEFTDVIPQAHYLLLFNVAWHEYLGLLWGGLRGHVKIF